MFHRDATARTALEGDQLTQAMVGIGMLFGAEPSADPNIEDTIFSASELGMIDDDYRVLGVLVDWISVHHPWVNADRLVRLVQSSPSLRVQAFWKAIAQIQASDRRFARLMELSLPTRCDLLRVGTDFQVRRKGEDSRFVHTVLRVPNGTLRSRPSTILTPHQLAQRHPTYRWRVIIGPSYRADMWAALEQDPSLTPTELARRTFGSFASAWQVVQHASIVRPSK